MTISRKDFDVIVRYSRDCVQYALVEFMKERDVSGETCVIPCMFNVHVDGDYEKGLIQCVVRYPSNGGMVEKERSEISLSVCVGITKILCDFLRLFAQTVVFKYSEMKTFDDQ